jgi:ABC-type multidrug transport system fused ATPase/permease subunit
LTDFISHLPQGLDTFVGERGVRLSGGQRQRIGIARALYYNPTVLVLDEATSSLDVATEKQIMKTVYELQKDKTIVIVAHRLSTIEKCDKLYQLKDGIVIKSGTPGEILNN